MFLHAPGLPQNSRKNNQHTVKEVDPFELDRGASVSAAVSDLKYLAER